MEFVSVFLQSVKDACEACNVCPELILVPGGAVWLCLRGGAHQSGLHRGHHRPPHLQEPVSCFACSFVRSFRAQEHDNSFICYLFCLNVVEITQKRWTSFAQNFFFLKKRKIPVLYRKHIPDMTFVVDWALSNNYLSILYRNVKN